MHPTPSSQPGGELPREVEVAIVGAGFGGIGAAIRLRQTGTRDFVVLERADDLGGTWRDNLYPGCRCDVQSHLYSYSFALNPEWSCSFSPQQEIWDYLRGCAERFGVMPYLRTGVEVTGAGWDPALLCWRVDTSRGTLHARVLVLASGALSDPQIPVFPGSERFTGPVFHSSRWDPAFHPAGKRVAVIGSGASAVQLVPAIQPEVAGLDLYQRTAAWVIPRSERLLGAREHRLLRRFPALQRFLRGAIYLQREGMIPLFRHPAVMRLLQRVALRHLRRSVADPALRARLTPEFTMGCKRVLLSNDYLPALTRSNVNVVSEGIAELRADGIVTRDGVFRPADAIVYATGFRPTDPPLAHAVRGSAGRTLSEVWQGSPKAHLGTTVAGFPNLFLLLGPNTGLGHTSVLYMLEAQIEHLLDALALLRRENAVALEPHAAAQEAYVRGVDRRMRGTVWTSGGCASWYLDGTGRNSTLWPDFTWRFRRRVRRARREEYLLHPAPP